MSGIPWVRYAFVILLTSSDSIAYILIPPCLQERGLDYSVIGMLVGAMAVASLGSRFPSGAVYQRHRARGLTAAAMAIVGAAFLAFPATTSVPLTALIL